jgi:hypothetical protein
MEGQGDFVLGARVRVQGLVGAPEHNGKVGVITEELQNERVGVSFNDGKGIKVKLVNLVMVPVPISNFINPRMVAQVRSAPGKLLVDLPNHQISNLDGVQQLDGLKELRVNKNNIVSLAGVIFPVTLEALLLNENKIGNLDGVAFPDSLVLLGLSVNKIVSLARVEFPASLQKLYLASNRIGSLSEVEFPASLKELYLFDNQIANLKEAVFPRNLEILNLNGNQITSLAGVVFPDGLKKLHLARNRIDRIDSPVGVVFPDGLKQLYLDDNRIDSLSNVNLPEGLQVFSLLDNEKIKDCTHFKIPPGLLDIKISNASTNCAGLSRKIVRFQQGIKTSLAGNSQARDELMTVLKDTTPEIFTEGREERQELAHVAQLMLGRLHDSASASRKCSSCGKEETGIKFKKCGDCRTLYCSRECQKTDWPSHSLVCKGKQQEEEGKGAAVTKAEGPEAEGPEAEGGNKSKTRRQRRQSKRNNMQRKYKYSRLRRNAKSKSKSKK